MSNQHVYTAAYKALGPGEDEQLHFLCTKAGWPLPRLFATPRLAFEALSTYLKEIYDLDEPLSLRLRDVHGRQAVKVRSTHRVVGQVVNYQVEDE